MIHAFENYEDIQVNASKLDHNYIISKVQNYTLNWRHDIDRVIPCLLIYI